MRNKTGTKNKSLKEENLFLWEKIAEMEKLQLKYLIEKTEPKKEKTIGDFFQRTKVFNGLTKEQIIIGTPVIYWSVIDEKGEKHLPLETIITSESWALGSDELVCKVKGRTGGVSIRHLELREISAD